MPNSMHAPATWRSPATTLERRGSTEVARDVERIAGTVEATIAELVGTLVSGSAPAPANLQAGGSPTSLIIQLTNELHDARASARRAVTVARALAAMPPQSKDNHDG
jgi:hypothetical protein